MKKLALLTLLLMFSLTSHAELKEKEFLHALVKAAIERTHHKVRYDGTYYKIQYPNGDVPSNVGVCTDVVIRSFRNIGIDLQKKVHEDISKHFSSYPTKRLWGLHHPDKNIDHRRVPNLQVFFARFGQVLKISDKARDYSPGDLVTWMLPGNLPHIGILINRYSRHGNRPLVAHNIGNGPEIDDILFKYKITGHYRYLGK